MITCITGVNGAGKTNLLDAVYYLCYSKSYFTSLQQNNVQSGTDGFRVEGRFAKKGTEEQIVCKWRQGKKELLANGVLYEKVTEHIGKYAAVMIAPDDLELINEGSELRRKWIDSILGQVNRRYLESLLQYQRILAQRNAWLKQQAVYATADRYSLDFYDQQLTIHGTYIHECRKALLEPLTPLLNDYYHQLCGGKEQVGVYYDSDLEQHPLDALLRQHLQADLRLQRTNKGIHKDDWNFTLNRAPLKQFASQGQKKSFLFALKLAQYTYLKNVLHYQPILLLDDVFEKLDQERMEALLKIIRGEGFGQVLLTDTHAGRVQAAFGEDADIAFIKL